MWRDEFYKIKEGKIKKVIFAAVLLAAVVAYSQGWSKTYGGDSLDAAYCVVQTQDNGYIMVGRTNSFGAGSFDLWLLRTDSTGDTLWTKTYGGELWDVGVSIECTFDSNYIIVGRTGSFGVGYSNIWLLKIDGNGDTLWCKTYGEGEFDAHGVLATQTSDSGYVIIGEKTSLDSSFIWFIKTDENGDTIYTHLYGGDQDDGCFSAQPVAEMGYIVLGKLYEEYDYSHCLMRLYHDGAVYWIEPCYVWEPRYVQYAGLGFLVTGCDYKTGGEWPYLCLYGTDYWGIQQFMTFYGGENWDGGNCIQPTNDGNSIVAGYRDYHGVKHSELWLLKVNPYWGDTIWTRTYGGDGMDAGYYARQTNDGGYIVLGYTRSYGHGGDLWLLKTDSLGDTLTGIEEQPPVTHLFNWQITSSVGRQIILRYSNHPDGFHAFIFDAAGRKVDELHSSQPSGIITWGECYGPGVYFIRDESDSPTTHKVVLIQ